MTRLLASLFALTVGFTACAFPEIDFRPEDDGGSTSSNTGAGGVTGVGGGTGGALAGGGGQAPCIVGAPGQCPDGSKCTVDWGTGVVDCFTAGTQPAWTKCFSDADCEPGTFCDGPTKVCHPVCSSSANCSPGGNCIPGRNALGQELNGVRICTANCNPLNATPCSTSAGKTTCYYDVDNAYWDCIETKGLSLGAMCSGADDCDRGLVCPASGECREWCTPVNDTCGFAGLGLCLAPSNIEPEWSGTPIGICSSF